MTSIYKLSPTGTYLISITATIKNDEDLWIVDYNGEDKLFFKEIEKVIAHMYFYLGLSKMKNRTYEEIYEFVKKKFHLHSGEDILGLKK